MTLAKAIAAARKKTTEVCAPWKIRLAFWHPAVYVEVSPASYGSYSAYMRVDPGVLTVDAKHSLYIPGEYQMGVAVAISTEWEVYE